MNSILIHCNSNENSGKNFFTIGESVKHSLNYTEADLNKAQEEVVQAEVLFNQASDILSPDFDEIEAQKLKLQLMEKQEKYNEAKHVLERQRK